MAKIKIDIDLAIVQLMWLFLLLRITIVNQNIWIIAQLAVCAVATCYVIANMRYIKRRALILPTIFSVLYIISSLINRWNNGPYITFTGLKYAWETFLCFSLPWIAITKMGSKRVAQASWNCLLLYWIPTVITVIIQGSDVVDNANSVYFIGNKFTVSYLNVIMLCLYLYVKRDRMEDHGHQLILKVDKSQIFFMLFLATIFILEFIMKAYTGLFMILFILILAILSNILQFRLKNRWSGFYSFISKPWVLITSVILSGTITVALDAIATIPWVVSFLQSSGKMGTIHSRTLIYKNLAEIISRKPWFGYGHSSAVVSQYFGPNAQNGLAQLIINIGILGTMLMLAIAFYCGKWGRKSSRLSAPFLFAIYAFILSATVEITYSKFFFILLAFYCACGWEDITKRRRKNE